jgi:hypothetical protein
MFVPAARIGGSVAGGTAVEGLGTVVVVVVGVVVVVVVVVAGAVVGGDVGGVVGVELSGVGGVAPSAPATWTSTPTLSAARTAAMTT